MSNGSKPAGAKRGAPRRNKTVEISAEVSVTPPQGDVAVAQPKQKDPKAGWPIIWIDAVDGMPNYEEVGVNGNVYRIMRETEVPVPPEVVEVLRNAVGARIVEAHDPQGGIRRKVQKFSSIPWHLVGYNH